MFLLQTSNGLATWSLRRILSPLYLALSMLRALGEAASATFKSRATLQLENLALRHQLGVVFARWAGKIRSGVAPRIHGELFRLGIDIGETRLGKRMVRQHNPPSQTGRTFLKNHVKAMDSATFLPVPVIRFQALYVIVVLAHDRRRIVHFNRTSHPTAAATDRRQRIPQMDDSSLTNTDR